MRNFFLAIIVLTITALSLSCQKDKSIDYRQEMRDFVVKISEKAKSQNPAFQIIAQNGVELISTNEKSDGQLASEYISAIDGQGQEDLFFGYAKDDKATPHKTTEYLKSYLSRLREAGKTVLTTDYCSSLHRRNSKTNRQASFRFRPQAVIWI